MVSVFWGKEITCLMPLTCERVRCVQGAPKNFGGEEVKAHVRRWQRRKERWYRNT